MMNSKILATWLLCSLFVATVCGQEYRTGAMRNAQLSEYDNDQFKSRAVSDMVQIELPFFDNFKQQSLIPNSVLWSDRQVFVNSNYQMFPPNRGVATFDALNQYGHVYKHANDVSFFADSLTSHYINLSKIKVADSLYFSFFYQPQGRGDKPEVQDSLLVEFQMREKDTIIRLRDVLTDDGQTIQIKDTIIKDKWFRVFADRGNLIEDFVKMNGVYFKLIMIKLDHKIFSSYISKLVKIAVLYFIDSYREENNGATPPQNEIDELSNSLTEELNVRYDSAFFHNQFRFRFLNKASISPAALKSWQGNCDQWNVDNVYLNKDRTAHDTVYYKEIGFIEPGKSFLKNYTAVPYRQYNNNPLAYLADTISTLIYNGFEFELMLRYEYEIYNKSEKLLYTYSAQKATSPFSYATDEALARPPMEFIFPVNKDSETPFKIVQRVGYVSDKKSFQSYDDIIEYEQNMTNYFAYDDGTAELGYGLKGAGSMCAVKYELNTKDTLIGVRMYFNTTLEGANEKPFKIAVWRDDDLGKPGEMIYREEDTSMPYYDGENKFVDFMLDVDLEVRPKNLYVGWIQIYKENLNIGWDTSNPQRDNIFVYIPGEDVWRNTDYDDGCLMIRPIFKSQFSLGGLQLPEDEFDFVVYPNPIVNSQFSIVCSDWKNGDQVEIYNFAGKRVYHQEINDYIVGDVLNVYCPLKSGIYIVRVINQNDNVSKSRKVVVK